MGEQDNIKKDEKKTSLNLDNYDEYFGEKKKTETADNAVKAKNDDEHIETFVAKDIEEEKKEDALKAEQLKHKIEKKRKFKNLIKNAIIYSTIMGASIYGGYQLEKSGTLSKILSFKKAEKTIEKKVETAYVAPQPVMYDLTITAIDDKGKENSMQVVDLDKEFVERVFGLEGIVKQYHDGREPEEVEIEYDGYHYSPLQNIIPDIDRLLDDEEKKMLYGIPQEDGIDNYNFKNYHNYKTDESGNFDEFIKEDGYIKSYKLKKQN